MGIIPWKPPTKPKHTLLVDAYTVLMNAYEASDSFFRAFDDVRRLRGAKGTPTDEEHDLLRAGLVFAAAGLDAMVKQLIQDVLPEVIKKDNAALDQLADFVRGKLYRTNSLSPQLDIGFLSQVLVSQQPRQAAEQQLVHDLREESLQSKDQLLRAAAFFAIPALKITNSPNELQKIFIIRNQITHEMDIDLRQSNRKRRPRKRDQMIDFASVLLEAATNFFSAVEEKVR